MNILAQNFPNISQLGVRIAKREKISEEDLRQHINFDIQNFVKEKYNIDFTFKNEESISLDGAKIGRIDSRFGSLIIEYKRPGLQLNQEHRNQLLDYLNANDDINIWGVLTNGTYLEIYQHSDELELFAVNKSYSGVINSIQLDYISSIIAKKDNTIINPSNVNEILGIEKHSPIIRRIWQKLNESFNPKTELLYNEWKKLFNLSSEKDFSNDENRKIIRKYYSSLLNQNIDTTKKEYQVLFSIQTYYSIIIKLLLLKLIADKKNVQLTKNESIREFFKSVEDNSIYRSFNISNLVDGDFFSWYLNEFDDEDFYYFYETINEVSSVESNGLNLLMIHFYENVFPFHVRHAMGEFYTPNFLARKVVEQACTFYESQNDRIPNTVLDPCCGSGIFVLNALEKTDKVFGIDINPIAVLTAKINYLLNTTITPTKMMEIPIYLGDSTYFPRKKIVNNIECFSYDLITSVSNETIISFTFPTAVVGMENLFAILDEFEMYIKVLDRQGLINLISSYNEFHYLNLKELYDEFIDTLFLLERQQMNSIWLKIIGNYLKAGSLIDVETIVGNPPWVRWGNLPDNYREKIKTQSKIDGIFSKDSNVGGVDLNIAALICFISIRDRLNYSGVLGFLMPDSILFNKSYEGFRNFEINENCKYQLIKVERWNKNNEKPFDPVTLNFGEFYFSYNGTSNISVFDRKTNAFKEAIKNPASFNNHYIITDENNREGILSVLGRNKLLFRSGVSLIKGGHYLLKFIKVVTDKTSLFQVNETRSGRTHLSEFIIELENEIVYPFVGTPLINDNEIIETDQYCIFPYPFGSKTPYELSDIRKRFPLFYRYFMQEHIQKAIIGSSTFNQRVQKNKFDIGIFRVGEYTFGKQFLITRDNTKSSFAKVSWIKTHWGEYKLPIFDGHVNYVDFIDFEKTYKIPFTADIKNNLFNIFIGINVKKYIKSASDSRSISARLYNDIKIDFLP